MFVLDPGLGTMRDWPSQSIRRSSPVESSIAPIAACSMNKAADSARERRRRKRVDDSFVARTNGGIAHAGFTKCRSRFSMQLSVIRGQTASVTRSRQDDTLIK